MGVTKDQIRKQRMKQSMSIIERIKMGREALFKANGIIFNLDGLIFNLDGLGVFKEAMSYLSDEATEAVLALDSVLEDFEWFLDGIREQKGDKP